MLVRAYKMQVRETGDEGTFTAYASVFGNVDSYGTVIDKGAFKRTIDHNDGAFPLLFFHDPTRPIGMTLAEEDSKGLLVRGTIDLDIPDGRMTHSGMKKGYIDRMSIGFDVKDEYKQDDVPHYREVSLWEDSLITRNFAANDQALVVDVRAACGGLQRMNAAIRKGAEDDLRAAMAELRTLLGPEDGDGPPDEFADFMAETRGQLKELTALLTKEGSALSTLLVSDSPSEGSEPQEHSLLDELRAYRAKLDKTLVETR